MTTTTTETTIESNAIDSTTATTQTKTESTHSDEKKRDNKKKAIRYRLPGYLTGDTKFEIHTPEASTLFFGRAENNVVGLLYFGQQMSRIWDAAEQDDPYADWYLLKIYDAIIKARQQLTAVIQEYQRHIQHTYRSTTVNLAPFFSERPLVRSLWFRTPYGYLAANVIADFDELMRIILTAQCVGVLLKPAPDKIIAEWTAKIVALLQLPFTWQSFNVTRNAVNTEQANAIAAEKAMGQCPEAVLNRSLRSPFAPLIKTNTPTEQPEEHTTNTNTHKKDND